MIPDEKQQREPSRGDASPGSRPNGNASRDDLPPCERHHAREARAAERYDARQDAPSNALQERNASDERSPRERRAAEIEARTHPAGGVSRREFMQWMGLATAGMAVSPLASTGEAFALEPGQAPEALEVVDLTITINGTPRAIQVEPRVSLLDALRERFGMIGTRKGCNQGACGACTVHIDGERVNSCLTLAVQADGREVATIEGLAQESTTAGTDDAGLHPMQRAFIAHDGFQCGYCTSGQIMSAVAMMKEADAGQPSWVTENLEDPPSSFAALDDEEIRERMSGNICRCGAYVGMLAAINDVQTA